MKVIPFDDEMSQAAAPGEVFTMVLIALNDVVPIILYSILIPSRMKAELIAPSRKYLRLA